MGPLSGRIVVLRPEVTGTAKREGSRCGPHDGGVEIIAGNHTVLYVARGEGTYSANGRAGRLRPNTLIATPPGPFSCKMSGGDRELYVLAMREVETRVGEPQTFTPFVEYEVSPAEGRRWRERMGDYAERAVSGGFGLDDARRVKQDVLPYVWRSRTNGSREKLESLLSSIWDRLDHPLRLDDLAAEAGYTPNYLNDISNEHTGRTLGRWITDMRMARARFALERFDLPVAQVGTACGYEDPAYFSRVFRRAHGVPPATWRIAARPVDARYRDITVDAETLIHAKAYEQSARVYSYAS